MPQAWPDAVFHNLRAEGAFLVSARRTGGKTQWVRIKSLAGEPCRLQPNLSGEPKLIGGNPGIIMKPAGNGVFELNLARGEEAILAASENAIPLVEPLATQPAGRSGN